MDARPKRGGDHGLQIFGNAFYIRADRGDELISAILDVCGREGIRSATFWASVVCAVRYTDEILLRPVEGGVIHGAPGPEAGT